MIFDRFKPDYDNLLYNMLIKNIREIEYFSIGEHRNYDISRLYEMLDKCQNEYDKYTIYVTPMYIVTEHSLSNARNCEKDKYYQETINYINSQINDIIDNYFMYITYVSMKEVEIYTRNGKIHSIENAAVKSKDGSILQYFIEGEFMEYSVWKSHPIIRKLKIAQFRK